MPRAFHAANASSSHILSGTQQEPLLFNSDPPSTEPAQPGPPVPDLTVSPTAIDVAYTAPPINLPMHNLADMPFTNRSSSASPATPTPIRNSPTRLSAIQTVQTYLTHQAQTIQLHLTAVLPGLIQEQVCTQCAQLAQEISAHISSIWEEVIRPTGDQDDPMLPSSEEGVNKGSRGCSKQSARSSYNKEKGKEVRFTMESDNEAAETCGHHHPSQQPNNENEADGRDKDSENEGDEEISTGSWKYKTNTSS